MKGSHPHPPYYRGHKDLSIGVRARIVHVVNDDASLKMKGIGLTPQETVRTRE